MLKKESPILDSMKSKAVKKIPTLFEALLPILCLIVLLSLSVYIYGDDSSYGGNQIALIVCAGIASVIGIKNGYSWKEIESGIIKGISTAMGAILILLAVGAMIGTWIMSGLVPAMIYYGLNILSPSIFYFAACIICALSALSIGSSWTVAGTLGAALMGIAAGLGLSPEVTAGAVISGSYFGDKMSPLSDTTNLAPAMAGAELFDHIKYMAITTLPTFVITLFLFLIIGFNIEINGTPDISNKLEAIDQAFNISPWLLLVPMMVVILIVKKTPPLVALLTGTLLAALASILAQSQILMSIAESEIFNFETAYKGVMQSITVDTAVETSSTELNDLFSSGGMKGMMGTIWLIICAMVFGGVMDAIGALSKISKALLTLASSTFGLFASTVASCLALNVTASDQYLALVVPGKMFKKAYEDKGLAPENLSRTLEDSGTVTSVLVPWNTCGAYQSSVLGVHVADYFIYAFFNWISPFMTLLVAGLSLKIKQLKTA